MGHPGFIVKSSQNEQDIEAAMNPTDPQSFFDKWLTAYCDKLHLIRRTSAVDLVQPDASKPPLAVSSEKAGDMPVAPRKSSA